MEKWKILSNFKESSYVQLTSMFFFLWFYDTLMLVVVFLLCGKTIVICGKGNNTEKKVELFKSWAYLKKIFVKWKLLEGNMMP